MQNDPPLTVSVINYAEKCPVIPVVEIKKYTGWVVKIAAIFYFFFTKLLTRACNETERRSIYKNFQYTLSGVNPSSYIYLYFAIESAHSKSQICHRKQTHTN